MHGKGNSSEDVPYTLLPKPRHATTFVITRHWPCLSDRARPKCNHCKRPGASHGSATMGSEDEKPVTAEDVPQPVAEEGPKDGEAPLAPRPKRLVKPDVSRHKAEVDEMHNKLKERKNNIDAINDKIRQMQSGGNRNPDNHLYDRLKKLRLDWDAALVSLILLPTFPRALIESLHASPLSCC